MELFVTKDSVVRKIWGKGDTILFIFAGASAEFALNKAVDWLYFTGKLPADPLGRLFSTVSYARLIVFANKEDANKAIDRMSAIHSDSFVALLAVDHRFAVLEIKYTIGSNCPFSKVIEGIVVENVAVLIDLDERNPFVFGCGFNHRA